MTNRFLAFYNDELTALRRRAVRFAESYPKIAGRLRLAPDAADDPHVERLVQSFAYQGARIRQRLDDGLPELANGLLETLYPHFLAPVSAMTMLSFQADAGLDGLRIVPRGVEIVSEPIDGDVCRFVTAQDVHLAPIALRDIRLADRPFDAAPGAGAAASCLRFTLQATGRTALSDIGLDRLRLFLSGPARQANNLARLMTQHCTGIALAAHGNDSAARQLGRDAIRPTGFDDATALLPYPEGSFRGYRALTEFACLPEKFLVFDLMTGPIRHERRLEVFIYFDCSSDAVEREGEAVGLTLHTCPAINLFPARAEPVALDGTRLSYPLQADARRPLTRRLHSVRRVTLARADGTSEPCNPFFHRLTDRTRGAAYWQIERHQEEEGHLPGATSIVFVDHRTEPLARVDTTAGIEIMASNGDLPRRLPFGGGQPRLQLATAVENVAGVTCLRAPTPQRNAQPDPSRTLQLLSHLSLNHVSITTAGAPALRGILRLYDPGETAETSQMIDAIESVTSTPGLTRINGVLVSGTDVLLTFDSHRIDAGLAVQFGAVIDRFLGCYTTINSFTRLTLRFKDRSDDLARFPARAGEEALV
jgi:type VI secretion system protein ImpG